MGSMLDRHELTHAGHDLGDMQREIDALRRQLMSERRRHLRWRAAIERHLGRGCPSESLRALLLEEDLR